MTDAEDIDALMREAYASHEAGRLDRAEELYAAILDLYPESVDANYLLGEILGSTGRNERAIELLEKAISFEPATAAFHHTLGCVLQACGKVDEAADSYRNALRLDARNPETLNNLGCLLLHGRALDEARRCLEDAVSVAPGFNAAQFNLGEVLRAQNEWEQAEWRFRSVQPATTETLERLADVLTRQRKYDSLPAVYRDIVRLRLSVSNASESDPVDCARARVANTTLCCVDCTYHDLAIPALKHSMDRCIFDRVVFLTDRAFDIKGVEVVRIRKIASLAEYSHFMLKKLNDFIQTEYVLIIQYDGYVLDARQWTEKFFDYDYVGARWPGTGANRVGNGGFSLRSKRLLDALQDPRILPSTPEDAAICIQYRPLLEREYGIKLAPEYIADQFSFEGIPRTGGTFGFHGAGHLVAVAGKSDAEITNYRGDGARLIGQN